MQLKTIDDLIKFRPHCLCGAPWKITFSGGIYLEDDYTCVKTFVNYDKDLISLMYNIDSRTSPYGELDFTIYLDIKSTQFKLEPSNLELSYYDKIIPINNFLFSHFTNDIQQKLNVNIKVKCQSDFSCKFGYLLNAGPIIFNLNTYELDQINLISENFRLEGKNKYYYFNTNFNQNQTVITGYNSENYGRLISNDPSIKIELDKFLKYPFSSKFLFNKLKTFLLFY